MSDPLALRRVITGLDGDGRSAVVIDAAVPRFNAMSAALVWRSALPADNSDNADTAVPYALDLLHSGHANFAVCVFPPGAPAFMHATDTIDYLVILSGRVTLVLETGEAELGPGDVVVDRGVIHGWSNPHDAPCIAAVVNVPALPVGPGRTI
jgi:quercetin dioxygenase-like cupin family protein